VTACDRIRGADRPVRVYDSRMKRLLLTGIVMLACAVGLLAHHSYGMYYHTDQQVTLKGKVAKIDFDMKKPHVMLTIDTAQSGQWQAEWTRPQTLTMYGVMPDTVKTGDVLEIEGSPAIDTTWRVVSALREIRRPADGWRWVLPGQRIIE
jgi:hypothetical protein